ncbi:MAG: pantoate--beta-alanine ligase [candidate division Zixibacteria bacterium]
MKNFKIIRSIKSQSALSRKLIRAGKTIAVVPTMGYLHDGHMSLLKQGLKKADIVVTTIFVNPTQFSPNEDFDIYPRDEKGDIQKIKNAGGQIVFIPKMKDIYPDDFETFVNVENLTTLLESKQRSDHFRGVTTIVTKLFNITQPDFAMFGMKDYQQAMVIRKMIADLNWPIKIVICPTVREKDGLAMSSRNNYLDSTQRREARALYLSLTYARKTYLSGKKNVNTIRNQMKSIISTIAPSANIEYIEFTEMNSLRPVKKIDKNTVVSLAVKIGPVRLIDNMKIS